MSRLVLIRADASRRMGSGHVMRCLTLADALRVRGRVVEFVSRALPGNLIDLVRGRGFAVHALPAAADEGSHGWLGVSVQQDVEETLAALGKRLVEWLVVDHYGIDTRWERPFLPYVDRLMAIDDMADRDHACHLLLDQNFSLYPQQRYGGRVPPFCSTLLGPGYALLREEFARARASLRQRDGSICKVLVFFGGSDPDNLTGQTLKVLATAGLDAIAIDVVLGASNPHRDAIARQLRDRKDARLLVQVENMAELMARADLSIGAGGGTTWERMCLGLPSVVVTIADNQIPAVRDLQAQGLLRWAGDISQMAPQLLRTAIDAAVSSPQENLQQGERGMQLVDGCGAERVAALMCYAVAADTLQLRRALPEDQALYWHWVNDPQVRASAINTAPIPWDNHCRWFDVTLANPDKWLFVAEGPLGPLGQVRFERSGDTVSIGYSLAAQFRGRGLAATLLERATGELEALVGGDAILHAVVRIHNQASARVFQRLGFTEYIADDMSLRIFRRRLGVGDR